MKIGELLIETYDLIDSLDTYKYKSKVCSKELEIIRSNFAKAVSIITDDIKYKNYDSMKLTLSFLSDSFINLDKNQNINNFYVLGLIEGISLVLNNLLINISEYKLLINLTDDEKGILKELLCKDTVFIESNELTTVHFQLKRENLIDVTDWFHKYYSFNLTYKGKALLEMIESNKEILEWC